MIPGQLSANQHYHPVTVQGAPIYVHSKLMIIDDRVMKVGSSNFNNRSMRFDNECDVAFEAKTSPALAQRLTHLRNNLLAEHLGTSSEAIVEAIEKEGSLIGAIDALRQRNSLAEPGRHRTLVPYQTPEVSGIAEWLADNEILDPEGPEEVFEPIETRGLFRGKLKIPFRKFRR